ncbi:MAG: hypothetical protein R2848_09055 [Thermomicrobiales bacterium]
MSAPEQSRHPRSMGPSTRRSGAAPWSELFVDIEGDRKPAPLFDTRMRMLWDDDALYIGARLDEPCLGHDYL